MVMAVPGNWSWWIEVGLGLGGMVASLLFVRETQRGGTLPGCGPRSDCRAVSASRWAKVGSVPVSVFGLILYGGFLGALFASRYTIFMSTAGMIEKAAGAALLGSAIWFSGLQLFVLRRVCKFCMIYHGIGMIVGIWVLLEQRDSTVLAMVLGGCLVVTLIGLQILVPPKTHIVLSMAQNALASDEAVEKDVASGSGGSSKGASEWTLLGGRVRLTEADWPLLGPPQARRKVALMFDATCIDCRALYQLLAQAVTSQPGRLAVSLIPVPLDRTCNAAVPADTPASAEACHYARLLWSGWQLEPKVGADFTRWLMSESACPSYAKARSWLHQRLGSALTLAMLDSTIETRIQKAVALYRTMPSDKLPQLLLDDRLVVGPMASIRELWQTLGVGSL